MRDDATMKRAGRGGRRLAVLMLGLATVVTVPMLAQDEAPPPVQQPQGAPGPGRGGRPGPERMQQRQLDIMTKQLNLTPEQVEQVKGIQADTMQQMSALRDDTSAKPEDRRAKLMELRQGEHEKIRAALTEEQKTKFDAMQTKMRERREQRGGEPGGAPPPQN